MANPTKPVETRMPRLPAPIPNAEEVLRRMAEEQGVTHTANVETLEDLWESDEEFEQFLEILRESRRRG